MNQYSNLKKISLISGIILFIIILLLPTPEGMETSAWRTAGLGLLMSIFWIFEPIPIYATALLPLVISPLFEIVSFQEAATPFSNQIIFLFLGGFFLAVGLENSGLHKRFALKTLQVLGKSPNSLILGFLLTTSVISSIVNNTSTAMMMLPIALSVITVLKDSKLLVDNHNINNFSISILLSIAYGASVGGITTLIGTAPNIFMAGFINTTLGLQIHFIDWLYIGIPMLMISNTIIYIVLNKLLFPIASNGDFDSRDYFKEEYNKLGLWKKEEYIVLIVFLLAVFMWIFQPFISKFMKNLSDGVIAMVCAMLLFIIPVDWQKGIFILEKKSINKIPWDAILLFGGGLSIASSIEKTKLAEWMGKKLGFIGVLPLYFQILLIVSLIIYLTELTSNIATTAVFLPILSSIAINLGENPLLFVIPATISASCAFMLPVATPPNAIVYASGLVKISDMTKAGFLLNIIFIFVITIIILFIGIPALNIK
jgi:solute carrier family 13 (sodium-dependent dicarboxylate transporter), member 2/3/5